jgi:hypothetical protein
MSAWRAVFWGFFGVRKRNDLDRDADRLKPWQVILTGLLGTGLLVLALLGLVGIVTS